MVLQSRFFRKLKTRSPDAPMENLCEVPLRRAAEEVTSELPIGTPIQQEPLPEAPAENLIPAETLPEVSIRRPFLRRCFSESDLTTTHITKEPFPELPHERSAPEEPQPKPSPPSLQTPTPQEIDPKMSDDIDIPREHLPETASQRGSTIPRALTRRPRPRPRPRASAANNRLLALPAEIRLQIYDQLLATPRTIYMLEPDTWGRSHVHQIQRFDRGLFSTRHGRQRFPHVNSCLCGGPYDPRTTTMAVRFHDDAVCTHRIWASETHRAAPAGVPMSAQQVLAPVDRAARPMGGVFLVFPTCSEEAVAINDTTWDQARSYLERCPETQILELEFPKICSLVTVLKCLLLGRLQGWRELRGLSLLRIRLKSSTGGPLDLWEMVTLKSLAATMREEMQRQVLLRRGPRIEVGW